MTLRLYNEIGKSFNEDLICKFRTGASNRVCEISQWVETSLINWTNDNYSEWLQIVIFKNLVTFLKKVKLYYDCFWKICFFYRRFYQIINFAYWGCIFAHMDKLIMQISNELFVCVKTHAHENLHSEKFRVFIHIQLYRAINFTKCFLQNQICFLLACGTTIRILSLN